MDNFLGLSPCANAAEKEVKLLMQTYDAVSTTGKQACNPDAGLVYCGLFKDRVAERVCLLLKKELQEWWSSDMVCRGCHRH